MHGHLSSKAPIVILSTKINFVIPLEDKIDIEKSFTCNYSCSYSTTIITVLSACPCKPLGHINKQKLLLLRYITFYSFKASNRLKQLTFTTCLGARYYYPCFTDGGGGAMREVNWFAQGHTKSPEKRTHPNLNILDDIVSQIHWLQNRKCGSQHLLQTVMLGDESLPQEGRILGAP